MPFSAGFDAKYYPKIETMNWLRANSNLKWCGYYLAPAPNRSDTGWPGQYNALAADWGVVPIYVGQQDANTGNGNYVPSSVLTAAKGTVDGQDAASLAAKDGFPNGTSIYLDWEQGDLNADGAKEYIGAWVQSLLADNRFMPAIYCSHGVVVGIVAILDSLNPTPSVRFWCWKVLSNDPHPFRGDLSNLPTPDPSGCGVAGADVWQLEQNAIVDIPSLPGEIPASSIRVDFNTAKSNSPASVQAISRNYADFGTWQEALNSPIPFETSLIRSAGFGTPGDGGEGLYFKLPGEPEPGMKPRCSQMADKIWWCLAGTSFKPQQFGAVVAEAASNDDSDAIKSAINSAASCGGEIVIDAPLTFNGTLDFPPSVTLVFKRGGYLRGLAKKNLISIECEIDARPVQIFYDCVPKLTYGSQVPVEWLGAKGDNKTDDHPAIQAAIDMLADGVGGAILFAPKSYVMFKNVVVSRSNIGMQGAGTNQTFIVVKAKGDDGASIGAFQFGGTEPTNYVNNCFCYGVSIKRIYPYIDDGSAGGNAVAGQYTHAFRLQDVDINDFLQGVYLLGAKNTTCRDVNVQYVADRRPQPAPTDPPLKPLAIPTKNTRGFVIDCITDNCSSIFDHCSVGAPVIPPEPPTGNLGSIGFYVTGKNIGDLVFDKCQTNGCATGYRFEFAPGHDAGEEDDKDANNSDIQISNCVADSFQIAGIAAVGASTTNALSILGGWYTGLHETHFVDLIDCQCVNIANVQFWAAANYSKCVGVSAVNCRQISVVSCMFVNLCYGVWPIKTVNSIVNACTFTASPRRKASSFIVLESSSGVTITNNAFGGSCATAVYLDDTNQNCIFLGNTFDVANTGGGLGSDAKTSDKSINPINDATVQDSLGKVIGHAPLNN